MIDNRFVDVDFTREKRYTAGALPRVMDLFAGPSAQDVVPLIPRGQWPDLIAKREADGVSLSRMVSRIFDQKNEGSCVANATAQAHEICQAAQFGKANVIELSAISLYKRIGSSPDSGAMIDDALDEIRKGGILPRNSEENIRRFGGHVMPETGYYTRWPSGWESTAVKFAGGEAFIVNDSDELVSVLFAGFPIVVGRRGHSICYCDPMLDSRGRIVVKYANSWAPDWGDNGFGYDSEQLFRESADWAFGLRTVRSPYAEQFSLMS